VLTEDGRTSAAGNANVKFKTIFLPLPLPSRRITAQRWGLHWPNAHPHINQKVIKIS